MECTELPAPHLENGWLSHVRETLTELKGSVFIKDQWTPSLQRSGDKSIMETFCKIPKQPGTSNGRLRIANEVRIWLRVITIADRVNVGGTCIPRDRLDGSWRNCSSLNWPELPTPSKKMLDTFHWYLRKSCCTTPLRQRKDKNMPLDNRLGHWNCVGNHSIYEYVRTKEWLYKTTVKDFCPTTTR